MRSLMLKLGVCALALIGAAGLGLAPDDARAQQEQEQLHFVLVHHAPDSDTWWNTVVNAVTAAADRMGVTVDVRNPPHGDLATMARIIEQTIAAHPDGLITTIADYDLLEGPIREAVKRGIPVITINSGTEEQSEKLGALMHIGQPEYYAGLQAGKRAREAGVTNFLCVNHYITNPASVQRCAGYADGLGVELDGHMIDSGIDPTEVQLRVSAYLRQHPKTDGIIALGPNSANPTIRALKDLGIAGKIHFATFDLSPQIVEAIKNGIIDFAIDQQPYLQGYLPVVLLALYNRYGLMPANNIRSGPGFVTKENVGLVEELAGKVR